MPTNRTIIVCLPADITTDQLTTEAIRRYQKATTNPSPATPVSFFAIRGRRRDRKSLLAPTTHKMPTAAGGPIRVLDLALTAEYGRRRSWHRWQIWNQIVQGTRSAQPYWQYAQRVCDNKRYPLARAQQDYLAQSRIAVMNQYNLLPNRVMDIPTAQLEAFQTTIDAYIHLGGMTAVAANGLVTLSGKYLAPATADRLSDIHTYLRDANAELGRLAQDHQLVALSVH